ncbi:MAG: hypothetical protein ACRD3D_14550 [Terriglobia bacterium]
MLCLIDGIPEFADHQAQISNLKLEAEGTSRQLRAWADKLQDSGIKGQRYLDERGRKREHAAQDREAFLKELESFRQRPVSG